MNNPAVKALIKPPMNENTVDIFCTCRSYLYEVDDLTMR